MYDVIIIGAGSAGLSAGIYLAKNKIKTLVLTKEVLPLNKEDADELITYKQLKEKFEERLSKSPNCLEFLSDREVISLEKNIVSFSAEIKNGTIYYSKAVILATGQKAEAAFELLTLKDQAGKVKVDADMKTNISGIFAAGGATVSAFSDVLTSAGEGAKAAILAKNFLMPKY